MRSEKEREREEEEEKEEEEEEEERMAATIRLSQHKTQWGQLQYYHF